jgi:hypothetical protein
MGKMLDLHSVVAGESTVLRALVNVLADDAGRNQKEHPEDNATINESILLLVE